MNLKDGDTDQGKSENRVKLKISEIKKFTKADPFSDVQFEVYQKGRITWLNK